MAQGRAIFGTVARSDSTAHIDRLLIVALIRLVAPERMYGDRDTTRELEIVPSAEALRWVNKPVHSLWNEWLMLLAATKLSKYFTVLTTRGALLCVSLFVS